MFAVFRIDRIRRSLETETVVLIDFPGIVVAEDLLEIQVLRDRFEPCGGEPVFWCATDGADYVLSVVPRDPYLELFIQLLNALGGVLFDEAVLHEPEKPFDSSLALGLVRLVVDHDTAEVDDDSLRWRSRIRLRACAPGECSCCAV